MTVRVDANRAINRMAVRARTFRDVPYRLLEQAATDAASTARSTTTFKDGTGKTRDSIQPRPGPGSAMTRWSVVARGAAPFLENGTGRYGLRGRDYVITPKNGRFLTFRVNGHWVRTTHVVHPGIHATHFMHDAAEAERPRFVALAVAAAHHAIDR